MSGGCGVTARRPIARCCWRRTPSAGSPASGHPARFAVTMSSPPCFDDQFLISRYLPVLVIAYGSCARPKRKEGGKGRPLSLLSLGTPEAALHGVLFNNADVLTAVVPWRVTRVRRRRVTVGKLPRIASRTLVLCMCCACERRVNCSRASARESSFHNSARGED